MKKKTIYIIKFQFIVILFIYFTDNNVLTAYISENNLHGIIHFNREASDDIVIITGHVKTLETRVENVSWSIRQLPVDYTTLEQRCSNEVLGLV